MRRCTARPEGILPAPRCILEAGHGLTEPDLPRNVAHQSEDGVWWIGPADPCPCGHEDDVSCECFGVHRLACHQRNEREDAA